MAITPAGRRRTQVSQSGFKHESIFSDDLNKFLRKISATGTTVDEEPTAVDPKLQSAAASPQLTDPARNVPSMETKSQQPQQQQPAGAPPNEATQAGYPAMPGSIESLPPTQRAVADLLLQKAQEQGLIVEGFQPKVKNFDFQDGNVINIQIVNNAGAKVSPGGPGRRV